MLEVTFTYTSKTGTILSSSNNKHFLVRLRPIDAYHITTTSIQTRFGDKIEHKFWIINPLHS